ncbi:MAG: M48 family metallopeptidase [Bacteroidia bacterium]|nr:M48 family metallopeptidase [Bacteroidia bacterium]
MNWNKALFGLLVAVMLVSSCAKVPFTGRRQLKMVPIPTINNMSFAQYDAFLKENKIINGGSEVAMVRRIGNKMVKAVDLYYKQNGLGDKLSEFNWEFNVVDNDSVVNAFCMPGGKVVVYTGIMKVAQNEDGLAVVMGHEIAHALAHHGNERMTQTLGVQGAISGIDLVLAARTGMAETPEEAQKRAYTRQVFAAAAGVGAQVGILLPFSRKHESEADKIGLYLLAMCGYDVDAAAPFWQRMAKTGGQAPPEFLSTHPHPETRQANLTKWAAEAREIGKKYPVK